MFFSFQSNLLGTDERYPHIVYVDREPMNNIHNKDSLAVGDQKTDLEGLYNFPLSQCFQLLA